MSTTEIRERLHKFIDQANDKKVEAFYTIIEEQVDDKNEVSGSMINDSNKEDFLKYLLSWPEMTDQEFNDINEQRKHFNQWK